MSIKSLFGGGGSTKAVAAGIDEAEHSGWLLKRGQVNTALQRRFFLLHGTQADGKVSYFESLDAAQKGKAKGEATVASVAHASPSDAPGLEDEQLALAFRFDSTESKRFVCVADSPKAKIEWMLALEKAGLGGVRVNKTVQEQLKPFLADEELGLPASGWAGTAEAAKLLANGDQAAAIVAFERVVSDAAEGKGDVAKWAVVYSQYQLGQMCQEKRGWAAALTLYEPALAHAPDQCRQQLSLQIAWAKWQLGYLKEAEGLDLPKKHLKNLQKSQKRQLTQ